MISEHSVVPEREERLDEAVTSYLEAVEAGQTPDRQAWLARYPECAAELADFFADQDRVDRVAAPLRAVAQALAPTSSPADTPFPDPLGLFSSAPSSEAGPRTIGDYELIREIGRGGMGVVFEARQLSLGRRVALKVLPSTAALDAKHLQRFKNEAHAAAQLQHQNIVPVYAVGCECGVHFYAMQFVEGQTLAALIRDLRREKAVEDRGLKENRGSKIEDRGSQGAALDSQRTGGYKGCATQENPTVEVRGALTETASAPSRSSLLDSPSSFFCTVAQLGIQAAEALEHAHQLGVIHRDIKPANLMVELTTSPLGGEGRGEGAKAHQNVRLWITDFGLAHCLGGAELTMSGDLLGTLRYMSPEQALAKRALVDQRTDIYSLGVTLYELLTLEMAFGSNDRAELLHQIAFEEPKPPRRINKSIPPELETIVLKAMEKNPNQRYATAQDLADDLRRYLQHEPIRAKKPTFIQRASKWSRRHPAFVRSAVLMLFLITAGSLLSTWLIWQQKQRTTKALNAETAEHARAEQEKQIAEAVRSFLQHKLLGQADLRHQADSLLKDGKPSAELKRNPTIRDLLDRAAGELTPERIDANFPGQPLVQAKILQTIGETYYGLGEFDLAISHLERSSALYEAQLGPDHSDTLGTLNMLAVAYQDSGRLPQAIRLFEMVQEKFEQTLGPDHENSLRTLNDLALAYSDAGRLPEAIRLYERVRDKEMVELGPNHPMTLTTSDNLAGAYLDAGRLPEAIKLFEEVRSQREQKLGPDHPDTLRTLNNLGLAYQGIGRLPEAIRLYEHVRDKNEHQLAPDHPDALTTLDNLACAYKDIGRVPEAIRLFEQVRAKREKRLGPDHPDTLRTLNNLGSAYRAAGRLSEAILLHEQERKIFEEKFGPDHPDIFATLNNLACAYRDGGRLPEAIALFEQMRPRQERILGPDHPHTLDTLNNLALAYRAAGRLPEAIRLFEQSRDKQAQKPDRNELQLAGTLNSLAATLLEAHQPAKAEKVLRECLAIGEKKESDAWTTFDAKSMLGGALLGQKKYAEAEPLLLRGYEGMKEREEIIPPAKKARITEALERLVQLYDAWSKPEQAAQWRTKLEAEKAKIAAQLPPTSKQEKKDSPPSHKDHKEEKK